jgi:hypothetical protein
MEMVRDELFFDLDEYSKEMDGIVKWRHRYCAKVRYLGQRSSGMLGNRSTDKGGSVPWVWVGMLLEPCIPG